MRLYGCAVLMERQWRVDGDWYHENVLFAEAVPAEDQEEAVRAFKEKAKTHNPRHALMQVVVNPVPDDTVRQVAQALPNG